MPIPDPNPYLPLDGVLQEGLNLTVECYVGPTTGWVPCPMVDGNAAFALHVDLPKRLPLLREDVCDHIARVLRRGMRGEEPTHLACGCPGGCPEGGGYTAPDGAERCPKCHHPLGGYLPAWKRPPASVEHLMGREGGAKITKGQLAALLSWSYRSWSQGGPVLRRLYRAPNPMGPRRVILCEPGCSWTTDDFDPYRPEQDAILDPETGDLTMPSLPLPSPPPAPTRLDPDQTGPGESYG